MAKKNAVVLESGEKIESIGPWTIAWRKFKQNRVAMAGLIIFVLIVVAVIVIPPMLGYSVNDYDLSNPNSSSTNCFSFSSKNTSSIGIPYG